MGDDDDDDDESESGEKAQQSDGELGDRNGGGDLHEDSRALALPRSTLRSVAFRSSDPE